GADDARARPIHAEPRQPADGQHQVGGEEDEDGRQETSLRQPSAGCYPGSLPMQARRSPACWSSSKLPNGGKGREAPSSRWRRGPPGASMAIIACSPPAGKPTASPCAARAFSKTIAPARLSPSTPWGPASTSKRCCSSCARSTVPPSSEKRTPAPAL